jgi:cell division protease FtsH
MTASRSTKFSKPLVWVGAILLMLIFSIIGFFPALKLLQNPAQHTIAQEISFTQLLQEADAGKVRNVVIQGHEVQGAYVDGRRFKTFVPDDGAWVDGLHDRGVLIMRQP